MTVFRMCCVVLILTFAAGCSMFVGAPEHTRTGDDVVVILADDSSFKTAVVAHVTTDLISRRYTVVADDPKRAKYYHAADFGAVVYMAEYWAWHVPWHQKRYYNNNDKASNIVFVVTSGDPDVTIDKPFDAVTSASKEDRVAPVSREIVDRLAIILK